MFDWFEPVPPVPCPFCGFAVEGWQGKDGPCVLLVWRQGAASPVDQRVDADASLDIAERDRLRLPVTFTITGTCPNDGGTVGARGQCRDGVWIGTTTE